MPSLIFSRARYCYRLRVSSTAQKALKDEWDRCRWVWNRSVEASKSAHAKGMECGPAQLDRFLTGWRKEREWLSKGASVPQQQVVRDFAKSRAKALKNIKNRILIRQRAGMPRFKRKHVARPSLNYTKRGFRIKADRLILAGGVSLVVVWSRNLPVEPSSVRVYQDGLGHWYASFVVNVATEPLPGSDRVIGIDWGVKELATTTSDDYDLPHPQYGNRAAVRLARYQRMTARRKPAKGQVASNGYRTAKRHAAKTHGEETCPRPAPSRPREYDNRLRKVPRENQAGPVSAYLHL